MSGIRKVEIHVDDTAYRESRRRFKSKLAKLPPDVRADIEARRERLRLMLERNPIARTLIRESVLQLARKAHKS